MTVRGFCHEGDTRQNPGGILATRETFETPLLTQGPEQLAMQKQTVRPKFMREKYWVKRVPEVTAATAKYTVEAIDMEKAHKHSESYMHWLRDEQAKRRAQRQITETVSFALGNPAGVACGDAKEDPDYAKPSRDMGMFSVPVKGAPGGMALKEPKLSMPQADEPLYLKSNFGIKTVLKPRSRIIDEDRLLITKFKPHPTTGKEKRECQIVLAARNILQLSTHPSKMAFGAICIQQNCAKSFTVSNSTEASILIRIDTHNNPALSRSKPESQVIPPGATAGFDIVLYLESTTEISTKFTYIINEHHEIEVPITAQAVPVMLSLNKSTVNFIFPPQSFSSSVSESILLVNQGNNLAEYKLAQGTHFTTVPETGTVEPLASQEVVLTFKPGTGTLFEETLAVDVVGGSPLELRCSGEVPEGALKVKTKTLDYGALAAGVALRKSFNIVGDADNDTDTVWFVDHAELLRRCPGLSLNPEHGALAKGMSVQVVATMRSERAQKLDSSFSINVRGGKPIKIKVKIEVIVPDAKVLNDEFDFGSTYLGATTVRQLRIANSSQVDAIFTVDLRKHHEFGFRVPEALEFEDDEPSAEHKSSRSLTGLRAQPNQNAADIAKAHAEPSEGAISKFRVPAKSEALLDLTFSPVALVNHDFELPLSMLGLPSNAMRPLRRVVCAEASRPRLLLSLPMIDFGTNIVVNENMGSFSYHLTLSVSNCDDTPCVMDAQLKGSTADAGIFVMQPCSASLDVGRSVSMQIDFIPGEAKSYNCQLIICIDGNKATPYFELVVTGKGIHPSIQFDRREVFLPPSPPGLPQKVSFFVINNGFDNLNLRHAIAGKSRHLPVSVSFPLGTMLNVVKQRIPVEVTATPEHSMSFSATIEFYDNQDSVYSIEVLCTADASLSALFPWLSLHKGFYDIQPRQGKSHHLVVNSELLETDLDAAGDIVTKPPGSPVQGSPSRSQPSLRPNAGFLCACKTIVESKSLEFLLKYCNMSVFKQPINKFPADIHEVRGKMIIEIIEQSTGKSVPGQIKKIATNRKEEAEQTVKYYREMCDYLRLWGAMIELVRADYLLPFHLFEKIFLDSKSPEAGECPLILVVCPMSFVHAPEHWCTGGCCNIRQRPDLLRL